MQNVSIIQSCHLFLEPNGRICVDLYPIFLRMKYFHYFDSVANFSLQVKISREEEQISREEARCSQKNAVPALQEEVKVSQEIKITEEVKVTEEVTVTQKVKVAKKIEVTKEVEVTETPFSTEEPISLAT